MDSSPSLSIKQDEFPHKTSKDTESKFIFIRHGQTFFNALRGTHGQASKINKTEFMDVRLTELGIDQAKSLQQTLNKLKIEKIYVSPFYRALQTAFYALENHPNLANITVTVHPLINEASFTICDFLVDIKKTKQDFNMETKVKFDWSLFDEFIKNNNINENFYYFYNFTCFTEEEKKLSYEKVCKIYNDGNYEDINLLQKVLDSIYNGVKEKKMKMEDFSNAATRFSKYKKFLKDMHKDTLNDKESKVITFSHGIFISSANFKLVFDKGEIKDYIFDRKNIIKNGEILSIYI